MGKGRDKRKKVKEKQKAKDAAIERAEKQREKLDGLPVDAEEDDAEVEVMPKKTSHLSEAKELEALIKECRQKDARRQHVAVRKCPPPSPRLNVSWSLLNGGEILMFGGEFYDGNPLNTHVNNELFKWDMDLGINGWSKIESINTPPPRCSHQTVVFRNYLYLFGGEFTTQGRDGSHLLSSLLTLMLVLLLSLLLLHFSFLFFFRGGGCPGSVISCW